MRIRLTERLKWRIADRLNFRRQCWSDLVDWVLNDEPVSDTGVRAALPWRPIGEGCRRDAAACGRCYCGKLAADGSVLRRGETVPVQVTPGTRPKPTCERCGCDLGSRDYDCPDPCPCHPKPHNPLCFDKTGHEHDIECECWCHDETATAPSLSSEVTP